MNSAPTSRRTARVTLSRPQLLILTALWIATLANAATLKQFYLASTATGFLPVLAFAWGGWLFVLTVTLFMLVVLGLPFAGRGIKWFCALMLMVAAPLGYFSLVLGTQFDRNMLVNLLQTNTAESLELVTLRLLLWVAVVGVLPAWLVLRTPLVRREHPVRALARVFAMILGFAALTALVVYAQYSQYASVIRNRAVTFHTVAPANLVGASISQVASMVAANTVRAPRGLDAHQAYPIPKPRLLIFVLGETARAQNHGLNGYLRNTTPRMRAAGGHYFPDTASCGTATAISVPCIFSGFSREEFSLLRGRANETLIDVVVRAGARAIWRDNDSGCKGVCDKADVHDYTNYADPKYCSEPANCFDEILLDGLEAKIRAERRDTLVVLHLKGSHGPAYHKRYPKAFEVFTPVCESSDLSACDLDALRNTYDNTIAYSDHVVGEAVRLLEKVGDQYATALLYVSDHGESLGESGLFLHGMPYAIAPREQTRVPLYAWVSPQFVKMERWDPACMARQTKVPRSHDNVYATVLGFMEIATAEYKPALDLFEPCDPESPPAATGKSPRK